ncbi:MAG: outer membrane lipoprotein carrier protein LolA [Alphaproteobacteria bacterium]|nr:outer membrane lipoprotein carrier protein LolA [Alphaproteobacteria bacterium]
MAALVLAIPVSALAETKPLPNSPVGAGWGSTVRPPDESSGRTLSPDQMKSIEAVNTYFNQINNLQGRFSQTNPDNKVQRGKFYLSRPGRFRFDYNRPSRQIIVSDGTYLAIQDLDLKNEDVYGLENTPFRILLRDNVDILRDAKIMDVQQSDEQVAVTLTDKSPDAPGQITIYLKAQPAHELAGWVTTDVQGGVTKVTVSELDRPEKLDQKLFVREKLFMRSIQ